MSQETLQSPDAQAQAASMLQRGVQCHVAGNLAEAATIYREILGSWPKNFDAIHLLGVIALQEGRLEQARSLISEALLINPADLGALNNLATASMQSGHLDDALQAAQRAVSVAPQSTDQLTALGTVLHKMHRVREALEPLRRAFQADTTSQLVSGLLGSCLLKAEEPREAKEVYQAALIAHPRDPQLWANLSVATHALGLHESALEHAKKALSLQPESALALSAQATAQFELGMLEEALVSYRQAISIAPTASNYCGFANALITSGMQQDAQIWLKKALDVEPTNAVARWLLAVAQVNAMPRDLTEIETSRAAFLTQVRELGTWYAATQPPEAYRAVGATQPFYLAYQPFNNRDFMSVYGEACVAWMKSLPVREAKNRQSALQRKLRVGFASTHFRNHSVWIAITKGWVRNLDRRRFDIHLFHLDHQDDKETDIARRSATHFHEDPTDVLGWAKTIENCDLDFLIYPAIGMDAITTQLASLRLASRQAVSWGHPETSGLSTVDYFISGDYLEPVGAEQNYTETLVRLPNLGVTVDPLAPKSITPNLEALGLAGEEPLLLCPGTPFKYSVLQDWIWIEISRGLAKQGKGRLVFFAGNRGAMYGEFEKRLRTSFAAAQVDFDSHVRFVPHLERARFFGLMKAADLMLDTVGFSGFNTAIQAIECGLPVMAFEGEFMRGRLASCLARRMDIPELIARSPQEFVQRVLELARDARERSRLTKLLEKRRRLLFGDVTPVRALEAFLQDSSGK